MVTTHRLCVSCGKVMHRTNGAKYCLDCSMDIARTRQAEWEREHRKKKRLIKADNVPVVRPVR